MCGRFTLTEPRAVVEAFPLDRLPPPDPELLFPAPRYNVAPGQPVSALGLESGAGLAWRPMLWGLVPSWAKEQEGKKPRPFINARAETAATKPSFRGPFRRKRCLVPADGFFEWKGEGKGKTPHLFRLRGGGVFGLAGLWDEWRGVEGLCLLTTRPNELVGPIHDRMPVILTGEGLVRWLDPDEDAESLRGLLMPFPAAEMTVHPVGPAVNRSLNDEPACVEPAGACRGA